MGITVSSEGKLGAALPKITVFSGAGVSRRESCLLTLCLRAPVIGRGDEELVLCD